MTIMEKYRTWLVENNVVPIGPEIEKRKLNHVVKKAHAVFHDVNNEDDDKNRNAVQDIIRHHDNASPAGKKHIQGLVRDAWKKNKELAFQMGEHAPEDHELAKIVNR